MRYEKTKIAFLILFIFLDFPGYLENDPYVDMNSGLKYLLDGTVVCLLCGKKYSGRCGKSNAIRHFKEIHKGVKRQRTTKLSTEYPNFEMTGERNHWS